MSFNRAIDSYREDLIRKQHGHDVGSEDEDELLDKLDDELDQHFQQYREQRMQELSQQMSQSKRLVEEAGHGSVQTELSEESVIKITAKAARTVLHLFHENFAKCSLMDRKLEILAQKHITTKFIRINVDNAPFLVTRLKVQVLPVVIVYVNGVETARVVGFEKLHYDAKKNDFSIEALEQFLLQNGTSCVTPWEQLL